MAGASTASTATTGVPDRLYARESVNLCGAAQRGHALLEARHALLDLGDLGVELLRLGQRLDVGAAGLIGACLRRGHSLIAAALRPLLCARRCRGEDAQRNDDENRDRARLQVPGRTRCTAIIPRRCPTGARHGPPPVGHAAMPVGIAPNFRHASGRASSRARPAGANARSPAQPALSGSRSIRIVSRSVPCSPAP